ncbi:hypothetical protein [Methanosarcina sp. UBA5]|nr:hypothetical protein [Methanosarcina sp. UBA5]
MTRDDYMLILGSNVYADPVYILSCKPDRNTGDWIPYSFWKTAMTA